MDIEYREADWRDLLLLLAFDVDAHSETVQVWLADHEHSLTADELRRRPPCLVPRRHLAPLADALCGVALPISPPADCGRYVDGSTVCSLTLADGLNRSSFQWENGLSDEWEALRPVVEELRQLARGLRTGQLMFWDDF